jgi:hypothetical protein
MRTGFLIHAVSDPIRTNRLFFSCKKTVAPSYAAGMVFLAARFLA